MPDRPKQDGVLLGAAPPDGADTLCALAAIEVRPVPGGARRSANGADVLAALVRSDLRARYGRGAWRLAKWVLDPFAVVGVFLILRVAVLQKGGDAPGLSVACAVVPFQLIMAAVVNAMGAVDIRRPVIVSIAFDRTLIPVASVVTESIAFGASFALLALMMAIYGVAPTVYILWLPVVVALNLLLALALAYPASLFGLWFRDLRQIGVSLVRTAFFLASGLVALNQVHGNTHSLMRLNPLTGLFEAYRDALLYGRNPQPWEILYPLGISLALLAVFVPVYRSEQVHFAKVAPS